MTQDTNEILHRIIAEGEARRWQDEPGTTVTFAFIDMQKKLEALRDEAFHLCEIEKDLIIKRRLNHTYSHLSAAVKSMEGDV